MIGTSFNSVRCGTAGARMLLCNRISLLACTMQSAEESSREVLLAHAVRFLTDLGHRWAQATSAYPFASRANAAEVTVSFYTGYAGQSEIYSGQTERCARVVSVYRGLPNVSSVYDGGHQDEFDARL